MSRIEVKVNWQGDMAKAAAKRGAAQGVYLAAEHVLAESRKVVPIEEGTLARSGTASVDEQDVVAAVSYDTPYARRQHEELTYRHDQGRTAKYLEKPALTTRGDQAQIIQKAIQGEL